MTWTSGLYVALTVLTMAAFSLRILHKVSEIESSYRADSKNFGKRLKAIEEAVEDLRKSKLDNSTVDDTDKIR